MKIIHEGVDPKTKVYQTTCYNCKTVVEYTQQDPLVNTEFDQREGNYMQFSCPICKAYVTQALK